MELTVEELIERLQEINDKHKKIYIEEINGDSFLVPVTNLEEKHFGIIINYN